MNCFPESTYAFFVDGELAPDEVRSVEGHLVSCRSCRALVVALQEENGLLADVLHERQRPSYRLTPRAAPPPRELALGVVPILGFGVVGLAVLGWVVESLPTGIQWLNPFRLQGIYAMGFDLLFVFRDELPGLFRFLVSLAGLASVSMLLMLLVSTLSRRLGGTAIACGLLMLALASPAAALDLRFHEEEVSVASGQTVDETLIVNADTVRVDGVVDGDLIVLLAERLILRGEVKGNVFSSARTIEISGKVEGNLHGIGEKLRLDGEVGGNMYSASELLTIAEGAKVERDSSHVAAGASIEGEVGRDLFSLGNWLEVRGDVGRHVETRVHRISLLDEARVGGDVDATFWKQGREVDRAPGAVVAGEVRSQVHERGKIHWYSHYAHGGFYAFLAIHLGAAFIVGMILHSLLPGLFSVHLTSGGEFGRSLLRGFVVLVATPIALFLVGITLLGIPLALIGIATFLTALYVSFIVVSALVGSQITKPRDDTWRAFAIALLVGLVVVIVGMEFPLLGPPVTFLVVLTGLGLLTERVQTWWRTTRRAPA